MGPRWIGARVYHSARNRLHLVQRRLPIEDWDHRPLAAYLRQGVRSDPAGYLQWRQAGAGKFFFDELPRPDLLSSVSQQQAVIQADALLTGRWLYFGMLPVETGMPPNWHRNPLTGECAPADIHWTEISDFAFGDIKLIWEASRFTAVYALVRAYALTQDDRYAQAFWTLVEDWAEHNPPQRGPNWKCGQESSFRIMAWCFGLHGFLSSQSTTPERVAALSKMIAVTAERIEANLGYALSQNNNHGLSEAMGLFSVGTLFPEFQRAEFWRGYARKLLECQARRQIYTDGSYVQHSMNYHRVMLHDYLWVVRLAELNGEPFSRELYAQLRRGSEFLEEMIDSQSGKAPNYGNNDGTLVLPLSDCDYSDFRPTLQAAYYLGKHERHLARGPWDEMLLWLFGADSLRAARTPAATRPSIASAPSGYHVLRGPESWGMIRCAKYHDRPGHSDQLHLDLWWRGLNIALDSGTYLYNAPPPWQDAFVTSATHNTVTVDSADPMRRFSRFLWLDWAQGSPLLHHGDGDAERWQGQHEGYQRLGVIHRRMVDRCGDTWNVVDDILGVGQHRVRLHWLFADFPREVDDEAAMLKLKTPQGVVIVTISSSVATVFSLIRAGQRVAGERSHSDEIARGWVSHTYASKEPALSLSVEGEGLLPIRFETRFEFAKHDSEVLDSERHLVGADK
jgi:hypothetical protein